MPSWQGKQGLIGFVTAVAATSCCLLPLVVVFLGSGSGAFMMTTMQLRPILFPIGLQGDTLMQAVCPGCSEERVFGADVQVGAIVSCDACAGVLFRLVQDNGTYMLRELPQASCPLCGMMLRLPDDVQDGSTTDHCEQTFVVTYAYGTYALEQSNR